MIAEPLRLDPQFEHLLREAARDPESSFLRVPRPKVVPALFDSPEPLSANSTGMSVVERELVRVHRNELAWLLKEACRYKLTESPATRAYISKYRAPTEPLRILSPAELGANVRGRDLRDTDDPECLNAIDFLDRCVAGPFDPVPNVAQLATAAWRLQPSDEARGLAAQHLACGEGPRAALQILHPIATQSMLAEHAVTAWTSLGLAFSTLRNSKSAHRAYVRACVLDPCRLSAWLYRFVFALRLDATADALECSKSIEGLAGRESACVDAYCAQLRSRRIAGDMQPLRRGSTLTEALGARLCLQARKVVDELA